MDGVNVDYNSPQPAQLNALAYAQGRDIHVAPGQERHLPHEAWHVVQQAQGRVKPTMQLKDGVPVNDDEGLEHEADVMGAKAAAGVVSLKVHTDAQSDQLNQSIQAKAFTTGQDVFFRQGAYQPGSRGGQELIAHELTHVVQQREEAVEKKRTQWRRQLKSKKGSEQSVQRVKIGENAVEPRKIVTVVEKWGKDRNVLNWKKIAGVVVNNFKQMQNVYATEDIFVKAVEDACTAVAVRQKKSIQAEEIGKGLEAAAARELGGFVSEGQDVQWRAIPREELDRMKGEVGVESDYDFMNKYGELLQRYPSTLEPSKKYTATPVDVYGRDFLALAGGASKFDDNGLKEMTVQRINELINICNALESYKPILVFNAESTTEDMKEQVTAKYGTEVEIKLISTKNEATSSRFGIES